VRGRGNDLVSDTRYAQYFGGVSYTRSLPRPVRMKLSFYQIYPVKECATSAVYVYNGHYMAGKELSDNVSDHETRFLKAFEEYNDALFRHAFLRISNRERAIDIVHDTYAKVWSYIRDGYKIDSFRPFLYKVLNNLIIDEYRKRKEASLDALFEQDGVDEGSFDDLSESSVELLAATIDGRKAFDLLEELPEQYREVIIYRFVDQLGPREISELIEESENVISVRIHRGLKLLRQKIEASDEQAEERRKSKQKRT
jgi:RNA polymerase sigma-70 factor (ECF subfamily)